MRNFLIDTDTASDDADGGLSVAPQSLSTSPIGSQFAPLNVASCNWRIGL
jgi:hypothetical protein